MKTAIDTIMVGRERAYHHSFQQMCSHDLVDPVACTPASGREQCQVEDRVGLVPERFFTSRPRVETYEPLNAWLLDQCIAYARAHRHPWFASGRSGHTPRRSDRAWRLVNSLASSRTPR